MLQTAGNEKMQGSCSTVWQVMGEVPASAHAVPREVQLQTPVLLLSCHSQVSDVADRGQDADAGLPDAVRRKVGEALASAPSTMATLLDWIRAQGGVQRLDYLSTQVRRALLAVCNNLDHSIGTVLLRMSSAGLW